MLLASIYPIAGRTGMEEKPLREGGKGDPAGQSVGHLCGHIRLSRLAAPLVPSTGSPGQGRGLTAQGVRFLDWGVLSPTRDCAIAVPLSYFGPVCSFRLVVVCLSCHISTFVFILRRCRGRTPARCRSQMGPTRDTPSGAERAANRSNGKRIPRRNVLSGDALLLFPVTISDQVSPPPRLWFCGGGAPEDRITGPRCLNK
ncbi:unnamed protein product [Calypogeia fissa]